MTRRAHRSNTMKELLHSSKKKSFLPPDTPRTSLQTKGFRTTLSKRFRSMKGSLDEIGRHMKTKNSKVLPEDNEVDIKKVIEMERNFSEKYLIIMPDSTGRMSWDLFILFLVLFFAVKIPLKVGFNVDVISESVEAALNWLFIADMVLNCLTAYKDRGILVTDLKRITLNYMKFWFWIDLIAVLPFDALFQDTSASDLNKIIRLVRIVKLFRVFRVARILKRFEDFTRLNPSVIKLLKMFSLASMAWHWLACSYWFFSEIEGFAFPNFDELSEAEVNFIIDSNDTTAKQRDSLKRYMVLEAFNRDGGNIWVPPPELWCEKVERVRCNESMFFDFNLENGFNPFSGVDYCFKSGTCPATLQTKYIYCFFWAVMVTTGIGRDIMPVTNLEHIFSSVAIILGVFMYAFIIGSASNSLANWDAQKAEQRQKLETINTYLRQRNVPLNLQKRIRAFYDYTWSSLQSMNSKEGVLADLHETLSLELQICLYRKLIEKIPMFSIMRESACLIDIIEKLEAKIYIPGEYLVLQGEYGNEMFILIRGQVSVLVHGSTNNQLKQTATYTDGNIVGENALLHRCKRAESIRASTYCDVLLLSKQGFDQVLRSYPEFRKAIYDMALSKATGWEIVRSLVRMARTLSMLGKEQDVAHLLLKPKSKDISVVDEEALEKRSISFKKRRRFSFIPGK